MLREWQAGILVNGNIKYRYSINVLDVPYYVSSSMLLLGVSLVYVVLE